MKHVALIGGGYAGNDARTLRGIHTYAQGQPWLLHVLPGAGDELMQWQLALQTRVDGVIALVTLDLLASELPAAGIPYVNTSDTARRPLTPAVLVDDHAVGVLVAEYLLDRGFRHFAAVATEGMGFSDRRVEGFSERLAEAGYTCSVLPQAYHPLAAGGPGIVASYERLVEWVRTMSHPLGVMATMDRHGRMLADVCRLAGLAVPEDVAIVGVDNFELVCELSNPPLSSVQLPAERIGYESARLLDAMMDGAPAPAEPALLPPVRVVTRRSSEVVAVEDKALARALRFIRDHARDGINVARVLAHCRISRSKLEHACEAALGRTPLQEIHRMQVEHACRLLVETDLAMPQVAHQSGLRDAEHLAKLFRRRLGLTPTAYRKRCRLLPGVHGVETGL